MNEVLYQIIFYIFALITIVSAIFVVTLNNIVRSLFALLFTFVGVAGLYVFLSADFLAATQILIYVGGILVLLIFGIMLTQKIYDVQIFTKSAQLVPGAIITILICILLIRVMLKTPWQVVPKGVSPTTDRIGELLLTQYMLPFEIVSLLLLAALIGAAMIARKETRDKDR